MTALFDAQDLEDFLGERVATETAETAERVVWGWLRPVLGLQSRPEEISDEIFSAGVELGAIAVSNPAGLTYEYDEGDERRGYRAERRKEILDELRTNDTGGTRRPRGSFPPAPGWPDPARVVPPTMLGRW